MNIRQLYQPEGSNLCGQTCVAMLAGISLEEAIKAVGTRSGTRTIQLYNALKKYGIEVSRRSIRTKKNSIIPETCIARLRRKNYQKSHWVLIHKSAIYDPAKGGSGYEYISSYLEIKWIKPL